MEAFWQTIGPANSSWKICFFNWAFGSVLANCTKTFNIDQTCKKSEWLDFKFCWWNTWQSFFWLHAEVNRWSTGVCCSFWRGDCAVFRRTTKEVALRLALGIIRVVESSSFFRFWWLKNFWNRYVICECIQIVVDSWQWFLLLVFSTGKQHFHLNKSFQWKSWLATSFCWKNPMVGMETKTKCDNLVVGALFYKPLKMKVV